VTGEKDHADVKIHPPILLLLHLAAVMVLAKIYRLSLEFIPAWVGYPVVLIGLVLAFSAMRQFDKAGTTVDPHGSVSALVTDGSYRFSRNPIYIGLVAIMIGIPLIFGSLWGLILTPLFILLLNHFVIQHEEAYLERKFGDNYISFKSRVKRWL
jgi:protein-S-isoprenylcysteine O-methyltransferase Ste14